MLTRYHLACVIWEDAWGEDEALSRDQLDNDNKYNQAERPMTFGLLLKENEKGVWLAAEIQNSEQFRHVFFIPRQMIAELIDLGIPKRKKATKPKLKQGKIATAETESQSNPTQ